METFFAEILPSLISSGVPEAAATAATDAATTGLTDAAATGLTEAAATALPEVSSTIPGILQGTASASPEALAASEQALATKAPFGIDLSSLRNSQAIDPTLDAAARQSGLGSPSIDLSSVANSQAINPTLSGAASAEGLGQGINLKELGIGNYFDQGAKSASDLFSNIGDKFNQGADWIETHPKTAFALGLGAAKLYDAYHKNGLQAPEKYHGPLDKYRLASNYQPAEAIPTYYTPKYAAEGGIMSLAMGGPATTPQPGQMYPQSQQVQTRFATPTQMPTSAEVINAGYEPPTNPYTGAQPLKMAEGGPTTNPLLNFYKQNINPKVKEAPSASESIASTGTYIDTDTDTASQDPLTAANTRAKKVAFMTKATPFKPQAVIPQLAQAQQQAIQGAEGGIMNYSLGGYAAGGRQSRLLKGPGDGMSDNIPATIADKQPARLADGEFVVPADVVSHLGNGSTDAGAKKLHGMMDKVRVARTGKKSQGIQINPDKYIPA